MWLWALAYVKREDFYNVIAKRNSCLYLNHLQSKFDIDLKIYLWHSKLYDMLYIVCSKIHM